MQDDKMEKYLSEQFHCFYREQENCEQFADENSLLMEVLRNCYLAGAGAQDVLKATLNMFAVEVLTYYSIDFPEDSSLVGWRGVETDCDPIAYHALQILSEAGLLQVHSEYQHRFKWTPANLVDL